MTDAGTKPHALRSSDVAAAIRRERLVVVLRRVAPQERLVALVRELADAGARVFEVTFDAPTAAADLVACREALAGSEALVGAGTIRTTDALEAALDAGAAFGVSPILDPTVLTAAIARGLPFIPGALSPTEIDAAWRAGATFVKLFPASSVGPGHVREVRGPMGDIELIPTGGIDGETAGAFLSSGRGGGRDRRRDRQRLGGGAGGDREVGPRRRVNRLAGLSCLVTGSTGIAAASAERFAEEGAAVFVTSRDETHCRALVERITGRGGRAAFRAAELTDEAAVEAAVGACVGEFGRIDGLFSVAGGSGRRFGDGPIDSVTGEAWDATLALNLRTQALVCGSVVRRMRAQEPNDSGTRGSILLMGSVTATDPGPGAVRNPRLRRSQGRRRGADDRDGGDLRRRQDPCECRRAVAHADADGGAGRR